SAYLDAIRSSTAFRMEGVPRVGEGSRGVKAMVERLASAGYSHGARSVEESVHGAAGALRSHVNSRVRPRRGTDLVLPLSAAHGILVRWALVAWRAGLLLLPFARRGQPQEPVADAAARDVPPAPPPSSPAAARVVRKGRRRREKRSSSLPGLDFVAAVL